jgi:3-methyladenine DNA glycosylase/8-oxoguanine DNA glycosylase
MLLALEAETREKILKIADDAIYERRNASIEQERGVKENEYNTEIAIENKRRQVLEAKIEAERSEMLKRSELENERVEASILLEEKRKSLISLEGFNGRVRANAKAYELKAMMGALENVAPDVVKALVNVGMSPQALIAGAFQDLAERAENIGQLNVTPDLLREIMQ